MAAGTSVVFLTCVNIYYDEFTVILFNSISVRLQPQDAAAAAAAVRKPDQQEGDITSQETSDRPRTPHRRNGSVLQANGDTSIHSITQSASRATLNRGSLAGSVRSPALAVLPKHRLEHVPDRWRTNRFCMVLYFIWAPFPCQRLTFVEREVFILLWHFDAELSLP